MRHTLAVCRRNALPAGKDALRNCTSGESTVSEFIVSLYGFKDLAAKSSLADFSVIS